MNHKLEIIPCFYPGSKCTVIVNRFDIVEYHLSDMYHCLRIVRCTWFCALGLLYRSLFIREKKSGKKLLWVRILFLVFVTRRFLSEWSNESIRVKKSTLRCHPNVIILSSTMPTKWLRACGLFVSFVFVLNKMYASNNMPNWDESPSHSSALNKSFLFSISGLKPLSRYPLTYSGVDHNW